jgi:MFS family permease
LYYNKLASGFRLGRELWLVEAGIFLNMLGYGAVFPFEVIYLHDARGFGLGTAGLVVGMLAGAAVVVAPVAGTIVDRFGALATATAAGLALAAGYVLLAFATTPPVALAAASLAGIGNGALNPAQSTLIAAIAAPELRHRANAVSRVAVNAGIGLGGALGGVVASYGLRGFVALLLANAVTYLAYAAVLVAAVRENARPERIPGGYRLVLRDRAFVRLALTNVAMIAVGWGVLAWVVPPYAANDLGLGPRLIGLLMLANALTVVVAQVPVVSLIEGRRRVAMLGLATTIWIGACLLALGAQWRPAAFATLLVASVAFAVGECFHTTALMPLVAELAPPGLRGRYMATMGLSWWLGLTLAPTLGTRLLSVSPAAALLPAAAVSLAALVSVLALEPSLPAAARLTPHAPRP